MEPITTTPDAAELPFYEFDTSKMSNPLGPARIEMNAGRCRSGLVFDPATLPEDVWLAIFTLLDYTEIFVLRRVCRALSSLTRLKSIWHLRLLSATFPSRPVNIETLPSSELESTFRRVTILERRLTRPLRKGRWRAALPSLRLDLLPGRPAQRRITWMRLLGGRRVLLAYSDGFVRCWSLAGSGGHRPELVGEWTGFGVICSGEMMEEDTSSVRVALATDLCAPVLHILSIEFDHRAASAGLNSRSSIHGPSGVFACNGKIVCSAFYDGRNYLHALVLGAGRVVRLDAGGPPQVVHCGVATEELLLVVKDSVLELYSMHEVLRATPMFQEVAPFQFFPLGHVSWKAVATHFPHFGHVPCGSFGVVIRWHGGITLYSLTPSSSATSPPRNPTFGLQTVSHINILGSVGSLSLGRSGYRIMWSECWNLWSGLVTSRLSSLGGRKLLLTKPRCVWIGEPPGLVEHCSWCGIDEAEGVAVFAQMEAGAAWVLRDCPKSESGQAEDGAFSSSDMSKTLLRDQLPSVITGTYNPPSFQETPRIRYLPREHDPEMLEVMATMTRDWYTLRPDLLPSGYTNDWTLVQHEWTNGRGSIRDLIRTALHLPGTPKLIMHNPQTRTTVFEVDGYIFSFSQKERTLKMVSGHDYVLDFVNSFKQGRVRFEGHPCPKCQIDQDVTNANNFWAYDHELLIAALRSPPRFRAPCTPQEVARPLLLYRPFRIAQAAAYRLALSVEPGVRRRRHGSLTLLGVDSEGRNMVHRLAAQLNVTLDTLHAC